MQPIKPNGIPLHVRSEIKGFSAALSTVYPQDVNCLFNFIGNVARKKICIGGFKITDLMRTQLIPAAHKIWPSAVLRADVQAEELKLNSYTPTCHLQEFGA